LSVSPSTVTLSIPATAFAGAPSNDTFSVGPGGVQTFRAATTATPIAGASVSLRVPALLAFRPESNVTAGDFNGQPGSFTIDAKTGAIVDAFFAGAATSSIMELSTTAADLGLPAANTSFNYAVASFSVFTGGQTDATSAAAYDVSKPGASSGEFAALAAGASKTTPLARSLARRLDRRSVWRGDGRRGAGRHRLTAREASP
jgi:hypothetical protein